MGIIFFISFILLFIFFLGIFSFFISINTSFSLVSNILSFSLSTIIFPSFCAVSFAIGIFIAFFDIFMSISGICFTNGILISSPFISFANKISFFTTASMVRTYDSLLIGIITFFISGSFCFLIISFCFPFVIFRFVSNFL